MAGGFSPISGPSSASVAAGSSLPMAVSLLANSYPTVSKSCTAFGDSLPRSAIRLIDRFLLIGGTGGGSCQWALSYNEGKDFMVSLDPNS